MSRVPLVVRPLHQVERIGVDDDRAVDVRDVEEIQPARCRAADDERGRLLVERAVTRAVELVLTLVPRNGAAEVRTLAIRRGDRPRTVDEEETSLGVEDR